MAGEWRQTACNFCGVRCGFEMLVEDNKVVDMRPSRYGHGADYPEPYCCRKGRCNVDYVWNARELYRVFLRTGGAPHRKNAAAFDRFGGEDAAMPYPQLLGDKEWTLSADYEETAILVNGKPYKCAVAHNLGQVRKLLEGEYRNYDIIRLMA